MITIESHQTGANVLSTQDRESGSPVASSCPSSCTVSPHSIQLTILGVPGLVVVGDPFGFRVEARCSEGCDLAGKEIEIWDHKGAKVATATLDDASCAQVGLDAPDFERRFRWTIKLRASGPDEPHEETACTLTFATTRPPENVVTVEVIDGDTKMPVKNAKVYFWPQVYRGSAYRGKTDESGVAKVGVPTGGYQLYVSAGSKDSLDPSITVASDLTIPVQICVRERQWWEP